MDKEFIENPVEAYKKLKQENERLKEGNKLIRQMHKDLSNKLFEFQKIEDTLQEIKEIVEKHAKGGYYSCKVDMQKILQKISEVIE